jgi:hypothetical protein
MRDDDFYHGLVDFDTDFGIGKNGHPADVASAS